MPKPWHCYQCKRGGQQHPAPAGAQMPIEWMDERQATIARYRSLFMYSTVPQDPPSASDAIIELFCSYATFGRHKAAV